MVGIVEIDVEGPLPPGINGGMEVVTIVGMGPPLVGSEPTTVCGVQRDPLGLGPIDPVERIPIMIGGMDVSPLLTIPP